MVIHIATMCGCGHSYSMHDRHFSDAPCCVAKCPCTGFIDPAPKEEPDDPNEE